MSKNNKLQQIIQEEFSKLMQEFDINFRSPVEIEVEEEFPELELDTSFLDDDPDDWLDQGVEIEAADEEGWHELVGGPLAGQEVYSPGPATEPALTQRPTRPRSGPSKRAQWASNAEDMIGGSSKDDYDRFYRLLKKHKINIEDYGSGGEDYKFGDAHQRAYEELAKRVAPEALGMSEEDIAALQLARKIHPDARPVDFGSGAALSPDYAFSRAPGQAPIDQEVPVAPGRAGRDLAPSWEEALARARGDDDQEDGNLWDRVRAHIASRKGAPDPVLDDIKSITPWWMGTGDDRPTKRRSTPISRTLGPDRPIQEGSKQAKNMKLQSIIQEEFVKLMAELNQGVLNEQASGISPEMDRIRAMPTDTGDAQLQKFMALRNRRREVGARRAGLQQRLASQRAAQAGNEREKQVLDVQQAVALGQNPQAAMDRVGISRDEYAAARRQGSGADIGGIEAAPARRIADVDTADQKRYARNKARQKRGRGRSAAAQKAIGGDYDKFYADLEGAGLTHMLGKSGMDRKFGKGHQAAFDALQAYKDRMGAPVEAGGELFKASTVSREGPLGGPMSKPVSAGGRGPAQSIGRRTGGQSIVGAPKAPAGPTFTGSPEQICQGMSQPKPKPAPAMATEPKPKPFRFDQTPMQESKKIDSKRMKLLAGIKKKS